MEWLIVFGIAGAWYYFAGNKQVNREVTKEKIVQRFETNDGYVERETTRTYESDVTDFKKQDFVNQPTPPSAQRAQNITASSRVEREINLPPPPKQAIQHQLISLELTPIKTEARRVMISSHNTEDHSKRCPNCNRVQPLSEYSPNKNTPDGVTKWCTACMSAPKSKPNGLRKCPKCKQMRRIDSFGKSPTNPDGLHKWCKFCHRQ